MANFDFKGLAGLNNKAVAVADSDIRLSISEMTPDLDNEGAFAVSLDNEDEMRALAESLIKQGQEHSFIVRKADEGKGYIILDGHRRYFAIKMLIDEGRLTGNEKWRCTVKDFSFDANTTDEQKQRAYRATMYGCNEYRAETLDGVRYEQYLLQRAIFEDMKKDKAAFKAFCAENNPKFSQMRNYLAAVMGVSTGTVSYCDKIYNFKWNELETAVRKCVVPIQVACEMIDLPAEVRQTSFDFAIKLDGKGEDGKRMKIEHLSRVLRDYNKELVDTLEYEREQKEIQQEIDESEGEKEDKPKKDTQTKENDERKPSKEKAEEKPNYDKDEGKSKPSKVAERVITKNEVVPILRCAQKMLDSLFTDDMRNAFEGVVKKVETLVEKDDMALFEMIDSFTK